MRVLVYTILFLSSSSILAQQGNVILNGTTNNNNTNNNIEINRNSNAAPISITEEEEVELDSIIQVIPAPATKISSESIKKKEIQKAPKSGKYKPSKRSKEVRSVEAEPAMENEVQEDQYLDLNDSRYSAVESGRAVEMEKVSVGFSSTNISSDTQRTSRSPSFQQQIQMDQAVDYFEVNAPGSFESHYFKYVAGNYNVDLYSDLKSAEEIRPKNSDVHVQMAGYYMIENDVDSALIYTDKLRGSSRLSDNVVAYSGDILRSVPVDGALITHGFDDSYGSFHAQNSIGIRPDVTLISLDFLQSDAYKANLKTKGYKLPESELIDVDYLAEFCVLNVDKNLSISLTTPKEYFQAIQDKLYVVGLVFEYHEESFDNFARNDDLWNNSMEKGVISNPIDEKGKQLSANYLPMLLHLRKVYEVTGEKEKMKEVDEVSDQVGVQCRKYEQVQKVKASY